MLVDGEEKARIKRRNRRVWVRGWIARRQEMGAIHRIVQELATEVPSSFMEYLRMDEDHFNHLVSLVSPLIKTLYRRETYILSRIKCPTRAPKSYFLTPV